MKLKLPSFEKPLAKLRSFRWQAKSQAISRDRMPVRRKAAMRRSAADDFDELEEPTTKLSSAFIVVLILHIVAVAGIYAFNSIKAHRRSREVPIASSAEKTGIRVAASGADSSGGVVASGTSSRLAASASNVPAQKVYQAHGGEALAKVAALQGVSTSELAQLNGLREGAVLKPGQSVVIPPSKSAKAAAAASTASNEAGKANFLASTRNEDAAFLNKATAPATTKAGTAAKAGTPAAKSPTVTATKTYAVAKGDTLISIAKKNNVSVEELMKLNKIEDSKKLQIAQTLKVPVKKAE